MSLALPAAIFFHQSQKFYKVGMKFLHTIVFAIPQQYQAVTVVSVMYTMPSRRENIINEGIKL